MIHKIIFVIGYFIYFIQVIYFILKEKKMNEYSPIEYIKENEELPTFLVVSARFDMGLEVDAKRFVEKLKNCHHSLDYFIVNVTHATIASKFAKNNAHKHFYLFIRQHMRY